MSAHPTIVTMFGSFVAESHDDPLSELKPAARRRSALLILLITVLLAATIPALALTTVKHLRTTENTAWQQQQPTYFLKVPPNVGFDPALF
jgi:hypothetical protein